MGAWICPDCGEPNNGDLCTKCYRQVPISSPMTNSPDSYLGITQGSIGPMGCPVWLARLFGAAAIAFIVSVVIGMIWSATR